MDIGTLAKIDGGKNNGSIFNIGLGYDLSRFSSIAFSHGTGFKAPTFNDLYWPADAFFKGNPDLNPEQSKSADIGLVYSTNNSSYSLNYYQTEIEQLIAYINAYPNVSMMENVDHAKIEGIELTINTNYQNWLFQAQLSANNLKNQQSKMIVIS